MPKRLILPLRFFNQGLSSSAFLAKLSYILYSAGYSLMHAGYNLLIKVGS